MIAHRGLKLFENKFMFFQPVLKRRRIRGIEFDVHENSRGQMVVTHDHVDADRKETEYLRNFPRDLDRAKMIVDIKTLGNKNAIFMANETFRELLPRLKEHDWDFCSFNKKCVEELLRIRNSDPDEHDFGVGYIINGFLPFYEKIPVDFISMNRTHVTRKKVEYYHSKGIKVYAWTVETDEQEARLKKMGVDEVIRDV